MRRRRSRAATAAALLAVSSAGAIVASRALAHPGPRVWLGNNSGTLTTYGSDNDLAPTSFAPKRAFVGGFDENTFTADGLLYEFPVPGTGVFASEYPGYQVRTDGQSGISTGSTFAFDLGPLLVFDPASQTFKTTWQTFNNPGPVPQMAASTGANVATTGPGVTPGFSFFSYNTPSDHSHLVMALLGNGTQTVDGPQRVYALPMQLSGGGLAKSLPYYILLGRNIDLSQAEFQNALSVVNATIASSGGTWIVDTNGNWDTAGNWFANVPSSVGAAATFGGAISAPRDVSLTAARTVGRIAFDNLNRYTIQGAGTLTLNGGAGASTIELINGSHTIAAPLALASNTTVNVVAAPDNLTATALQTTTRAIVKNGPGKFTVNQVRAASLNINAGTVALLTAGGPSSVGQLSISSSAALDLNDSDLVTGTPKPIVEAHIVHARNGGAWNRTGITSTAARNNPAGNTSLGVLSGAEFTAFGAGPTFSGLPYVPSDTLVKYTWNGDTDLSGTVNFDDYVRADVGFNTGLTGWANGDFDYSGVVNFDDYVMIDVAFNTQNGTLATALDYLLGAGPQPHARTSPGVRKVIEHLDKFGAPYASSFLASVPEPSTLLLGGAIASAAILRRRRRVRRAHRTRFATNMPFA